MKTPELRAALAQVFWFLFWMGVFCAWLYVVAQWGQIAQQ
jgi:hypothetical protein